MFILRIRIYHTAINNSDYVKPSRPSSDKSLTRYQSDVAQAVERGRDSATRRDEYSFAARCEFGATFFILFRFAPERDGSRLVGLP